MMGQTVIRDRPSCTCHGLPACVHASGGNPARRRAGGGGEDPGREWHCMVDGEGCVGYSVVLLVAEEWLNAET